VLHRQKRIFGFCLWVGLCGWTKANVPFAGGNKIELKKMCIGDNNKHNSCAEALSPCPYNVGFGFLHPETSH
jgi:hypothetical protein